MLQACLTALLWSCSSVCAARSARMVGGARANVSRMIVAALLLAVWAHTIGRAALGGASLPWYLLSGVVGFGLGDIAMFGALPRIGARLTMVLTHCLAAPLAATVEWLWLGTRLGWAEVACAVVILGGVALALAPDHGTDVPRRTFWFGVLCGLGSACGQGLGAVLSNRAKYAAIAVGQPLDGGTAAYERIVAGIVVALVFFVLLHRRERQPAPGVWPKAWGWIFVNALAGPSIGVATFQWALMVSSSGIVLPIVAVSPVLTQFVAWGVDGVPPSRRTVIGGVIAVAGVVGLRLLLPS